MRGDQISALGAPTPPVPKYLETTLLKGDFSFSLSVYNSQL